MADPVTDNQIINWEPDAATTDTNLPQGSSSMAPGGPTELAGELRVIKSVCREESLNKSWERWAGQYGTLTIVDGTHFTLTGDQRTSNNGPVEVNRRIKALLSASTVYGYISAVSFATGVTTVTVVCDSGALDNTCSEIQFGVPLDIALPEDVLRANSAPLYGVATGTNTYAVSIPVVTAYVNGVTYTVKFTNASTGAVTLNINSLGDVPVTDVAGNQLGAGSIPANGIFELVYDSVAGAFVAIGVGTGSGAVITLNVQAGSIGTPASTVETTLFTYTLPASQLALNGQYLQIFAQLQSNGQNGNRIRLDFGGTTIGDFQHAFATASQIMTVGAMIVRTGAASQRASAWLYDSGPGGWNQVVYATTPAETLSGTVVIKVTGQNGASTLNAIVGNIWTVQQGG